MGIYWWFDDALKAARKHASETGKRTRVAALAGMWQVTEVGA